MISVVIPLCNEAEILDELVSRCLDTCATLERAFEVIMSKGGAGGELWRGLRRNLDDRQGAIPSQPSNLFASQGSIFKGSQ